MAKSIRTALVSMYGVENSGVRQLSAVLKQDGREVSTVFFKNWRNNDVRAPSQDDWGALLSLLGGLRPDVVGIGFGTPYVKIVSELTRRIRARMRPLIVWGGIHATVVPEPCLAEADAVCVGEGERPLRELVAGLCSGQDIAGIANLWVRTADGVRRNEPGPLLQDLDQLPYRDFEDQGKFFVEDGRVREGDPLALSAELRTSASRGCPFSCSYCYNSVLRGIYRGQGDYFRRRSVGHVIGELEYALRRLPRVRRVKFDDDTFSSDPAWVEEFCAQYERRVALPFDLMLVPQHLDEGRLARLKRAGLVRVQIGIESASPGEEGRVYARRPAHEKILAYGEWNRRLGLETVYDVILDNPLSTEADRDAQFEFLMEVPGPFRLFLYSLVFFPKTALTEDFLRRGLITEAQVEGNAVKSWEQFRASFHYPRPKAELFFLSILVLLTKPFVPRALLRRLWRSAFLRRHPAPLALASQLCNLLTMSGIALSMLARGELTRMKLREYGSLRRLITQ
ncbi:MAG: cobalamin-dependent protein [Elusimicrobia bacterium]|nr:cobalamin-dependent protein [Elusimicrobiota bacterium]